MQALSPDPRPGRSSISEKPAVLLDFGLDRLAELRALVSEHGRIAGLDRTRTEDLVLVVDELACNSIRHGGGEGTLRIWHRHGELCCEVSDRGVSARPLRTVRPDFSALSGRGLWLVDQLCDRVEKVTRPDGALVRVSMLLPTDGTADGEDPFGPRAARPCGPLERPHDGCAISTHGRGALKRGCSPTGADVPRR